MSCGGGGGCGLVPGLAMMCDEATVIYKRRSGSVETGGAHVKEWAAIRAACRDNLELFVCQTNVEAEGGVYKPSLDE